MLTSPRPLPNFALTSKPAPSSMTLTVRAAILAAKMDDDLARAAMLQGVLKGLLHDAIETQGHILGQRIRHVLVRDSDLDPGPGQLVLEALERRGQAEQSELRRVQAMRQVVHALGEVMRAAQHGAGKPLTEVGRPLQVRDDQRDLLAEIVVQFARDTRALVLLRLDQASAEV